VNAVPLIPRAPAATSHNVARNSALYFVSLGVPAVAALFLVPVTVRALGPARFGLLALAWAVAESTGIFDFGLGKATIRFVGDATVKGWERMREVIVASLLTQTAMGALAGILLLLFAPVLVNRVFSIAPANRAEATAMFRVLALHMPVLLCIASMRASLEGAQRFDISTPLRIPSSLASVVVPAWAASAGYSLSAILWILLAVRVVLAILTIYAVKRVLIPARWSLPSDWKVLREMIGYSGWVAVSTILGPVLGSFDRFTVGSVIGGTGLGYYSGASEGANRVLLIPVTAFSAMLPALSATDASDGRERSIAVTRAAQRQLAALLFPVCVTILAFGPTILGFWLGSSFAAAAGTALRILSIGIFLAGLAILPLALLYGSGRPDLPAKINLIQVALHVPATIILTRALGISGAALAVTLLRCEDLIFYEWATRRAIGRAMPDDMERKRRAALWTAAIILSIAFGLATWLQPGSRVAAVSIGLIGLVVYAWWCWSLVFSPRERKAWTGMLIRGSEIASLPEAVPTGVEP
jgi:O-antigen/teichoic acid export membrane protein